jgi:hypothetical protein
MRDGAEGVAILNERRRSRRRKVGQACKTWFVVLLLRYCTRLRSFLDHSLSLRGSAEAIGSWQDNISESSTPC